MKTFNKMMYFHVEVGISFFILLQLNKGVLLSPQICLENDITQHLNESINNILGINIEKAIELINSVEDYILTEFEYNISNKVEQFQTKFFFQNITIAADLHSDLETVELADSYTLVDNNCWLDPPQHKIYTPRQKHIHWDFLENKINVFYHNLDFILNGIVGAVKGENASKFGAHPRFENFTLTAVRSYVEDNDFQFTYNTTYNGYEYRIYLWMGVEYWSNNFIRSSDQVAILEEMKSAFLPMIHENMHNNRRFSQKLDEIFQAYEKPRKEIISKHPDSLITPHEYYYLIPEHTFLGFTFKNIVIGGLSNFESFKLICKTDLFTHTLLIRDVQGKMTLDYRSENVTDLEMNFQIDCLFVSKKEDSDCIFIQARYYTVSRTKTNESLIGGQSEVVINGLESAIAASLFPFMKVGKTCDLKTPLEKIDISNVSDWNTIKKSYKRWIPFNEDEVKKK